MDNYTELIKDLVCTSSLTNPCILFAYNINFREAILIEY